ncbi:glycoside hydrolase family 3 C-terminal domain-containing protein [Streptomyces sp. T028]|uniref:glycoside hydrolase family 3 protein n=1 Tax=Streptomyces sp. T028 TaxID=3394379 RepID=UPI003A8BD087
MELPDQRGFGAALVEAVRAGKADEADVDRAVRRVLRQKLALGLLDADWDPVPAALRAGELELDKPENRRLAHAVARSSAVLLANAGGLPLPSAGRITLIGPCADDVRTMFGCYSFPNHVLSDREDLGDGVEAMSLRTALAAELPGVRWEFAQGCPVREADRSGIAGAVAAAAGADVAVVVVGDKAGMFGIGTSGEGCDVEDLRLPGVQEELVEAVLATGTPVMLVVGSGRPYAVGRFASGTAALAQVFLPGEEGGRAVAELLADTANFSGKLPVQIPHSPAGQRVQGEGDVLAVAVAGGRPAGVRGLLLLVVVVVAGDDAREQEGALGEVPDLLREDVETGVRPVARVLRVLRVTGHVRGCLEVGEFRPAGAVVVALVDGHRLPHRRALTVLEGRRDPAAGQLGGLRVEHTGVLVAGGGIRRDVQVGGARLICRRVPGGGHGECQAHGAGCHGRETVSRPFLHEYRNPFAPRCSGKDGGTRMTNAAQCVS